MKKTIGWIVGTIVVALLLAMTPFGTAQAGTPGKSPSIQEDDPRWDCRTMGNRQCGVQIKGVWYVVTFDKRGVPIQIRVR